MREDIIHVAMRNYLKKNDWILIAGEFPGGTDDELYALSIQDPLKAKDNSPDPRRHSEGEIIPDLIAYKDNVILVIEAKVKYSLSDKAKLLNLVINNLDRLISSLFKFSLGKEKYLNIDFKKMKYIPTLAFANKIDNKRIDDKNIAHIYVEDVDRVELVIWNDIEDSLSGNELCQ